MDYGTETNAQLLGRLTVLFPFRGQITRRVFHVACDLPLLSAFCRHRSIRPTHHQSGDANHYRLTMEFDRSNCTIHRPYNRVCT